MGHPSTQLSTFPRREFHPSAPLSVLEIFSLHKTILRPYSYFHSCYFHLQSRSSLCRPYFYFHSCYFDVQSRSSLCPAQSYQIPNCIIIMLSFYFLSLCSSALYVMRAVAADTYQKPMNSCAVQLANQILENSICGLHLTSSSHCHCLRTPSSSSSSHDTSFG